MNLGQLRDRLELPEGQPRSIRELVPIAVGARRAVLRARQAIHEAGAEDDQKAILAWEALAQNLYFVEELTGRQVLPALEQQDLFGPVGKGPVPFIPLDGPPLTPLFLGRKLPMAAVYALPVKFDADYEESFRVVERQADQLTGYFAGREQAQVSPLLWLGLVALLVLD